MTIRSKLLKFHLATYYSTTSRKFCAENLRQQLSFENWYCHIFLGPYIPFVFGSFSFISHFLIRTVCFSAFIPSVVPSLSDNYTLSLIFLMWSCSLISVFLWSFSLSNSNDIFIVCVASKRCLYLLFKTHILVPSLNADFDAVLCSITSVTVVVYLLIFLCNVQYFWQMFSMYALNLQILKLCFMNRATWIP